MPELPEVETVKNILKDYLVGKSIIECKILLSKIVAEPSNEEFIKSIKGQIIKDIKRRGKWLIFKLTNNDLIIHLRMDGKFFIEDESNELKNNTLVIFKLSDGKELRYHDIRHFGKMYLKPINDTFLFTNLGIEPFSDKLTTKYLKEQYNRNTSIKKLLLDQSKVTGIGNIYADEILFACKINPKRKGNKLTQKDYESLRENIVKVLDKAINLKKTSERMKETLNGDYGSYKDKLRVHKREKEKCYICNTIIVKEQLGQRGTYYCPKCQKK